MATQPDRDSFIRPSEHRLSGGEWFLGAGFGMFVHWDHASRQGIEIGWPLVGRPTIPDSAPGENVISVDQYLSTARDFNPTKWDARELARVARRAGAQYVIFTARHHAGYSMFHSEHSSHGIEHSPFGRDIVKEYVDAVRAEGIRVGFYYSLCDWVHPDYPPFEMSDRPYPFGVEHYRRPSPEQWTRYQWYLRGQLTELLTNYGQVDILWFDGQWERTAEEWDSTGLLRLIKSLQPDIIINDRLPGQGDYSTPEQGLPVEPSAGPWEVCMTIGRVWQFNPDDLKVKSPRFLVRTLIDIVRNGGNFLLNIGLKGDGSLPELHVRTMADIGKWMDKHAESVIHVSPTRDVDFYGPTTARPGTLYLHLVMLPVETLIARNVPVSRIKRVRLLQSGAELEYEVNITVHDTGRGSSDDRHGDLIITAPEPTGALIDVLAVDFE